MKREAGFVMGVVAIALIAMSIAGVAILSLSSGDSDLAGQLKRQQQLQACALAGTDVAIATLPNLMSGSFSVDPAYSTAAGHHPGGTINPNAGPTINIIPA